MANYVSKNLLFSMLVIVIFVVSNCSGVAKKTVKEPTKFVDAITQATTWNAHEGTEECLTDGKYPPKDKDASYFVLIEKGILHIVLPKPTAVKSVRIFFGEDEPGLTLCGYLGGKLNLVMGERDPEGELVIIVEKIDILTNQWNIFNIEGKVVDNFDLYNFGTATYYEIQVIPSE